MGKGRFLTRRNEMRLRKSAMVFMIFLMFVSGLLPSASSLHVQALEGSTLEGLNVSKDVEGEESKEVQKGENHQYNVNVEFPQNLEGYETVAILDEVDNRLTVQEISLLVDNQEVEVEKAGKEEEQDTEGLRVLVDGQGVLLELNQDQLEEFADKEIKLQITAQIKEDATAGESIESIAKVLINDSEEIETNSVVVTPVDTEATEEDKEVVEETGVEETKEVDKETIEVAEEEKEDAEEPKKESKKETKSNEASAKSKEIATVQPQNTEGITINDTDQYAIKQIDNIYHIEQYDGNDVSAGPKAKVALDNQLSIYNAIALGKNEDVIYGAGNRNLYKVYPDGKTEFVTRLGGSPAAATISPDGTKYVHELVSNNQLYIVQVDLVTLEKTTVLINDKSGLTNMRGGDLVFDADGNLWFSRWSDKEDNFGSVLAKINLNTGEILSIIPLITDSGENYSRAGALSFLPNGKMLSIGIYEHDEEPRTPYLFELDPGTGIAKEIIANIGGSTDFASRAYPTIRPDLNIEKTNDPSDEVTSGDIVTYTLKVTNTGNLASTLTTIQDELPEGVSYVPDSTTLNGERVDDVNGTSPIFTGMYVQSPDETVEGVVYTGEENAAVVTFQVTVNSELPTGTEIKNIATVNADGVENIPSNEVTNSVVPKDPELESTKSWELEKKAEGNTDEANPEVGDTIRYTITTKNTIEDSLIENLVITDTIPEGLTYVAGSLEVDGESVTDVEDDDAGHVVDGEVTGNFGDITDTDEHTVTFLVTVDEGQAGKDIKNIATVNGDNVDEPNKPEEEIEVYPREPAIEAEKSAVNAEEGKEKFQVGDTVVYTIQSRNTVSDSLVQNLTITDELPEGLEYVEGSLEVSHDGEGEFTDGNVTASFGDVADTEWRTVTFEAKIIAGQSGEEIENTALVTSDDTDEPEEPTTTIIVEPKDPELESEKSSKLEEKAEGNTDTDNVEVGDTVLYTIQTRNTIEDSIVTNLIITDSIPEGLEYVEGSLKVDGKTVTDDEDSDNGHYKDGTLSGEFGDITDTEWHTLEFLVTVKEGQAGKDIKNIATVEGNNTDEPDEPEEEVKVYPRDPVLEAEKSAVNLDRDKETFEVGDTVVYTIMTRNTVSDSQASNVTIVDEIPEGLEYVEESLVVSHEGTGTFEDGIITASFGDVTDTEWRIVAFQAKVLSGQAEKEIENVAHVTIDETEEPEEPSTKVKIDSKDPKIESEKSSLIQEKLEGNTDEENVEVGDTILYTIQSRNTIEDSKVTNYIITDEIPEGLEYVEGSLKVDGESVTDNKDDDKGHFDNGIVTGEFGDVTDTEWHTLEFLVVVTEGQAGKDIKNIATVDGDNLDEPNEPEEEVKVYPRNPVLESEKSATNLEEDKEKFEVGDTVVYTIKTRNTISDSSVEGLTIIDNLPAGLEYVSDSLVVDGESVTDAEDDDKGHYADGTVVAQFGDVTDTAWHTVVFHAKVKVGQSEKTIENIAISDGDNIDEPEESTTTIVVEPKEPETESKKSSELYEKLEGNTDENNPEVGDTLLYTIQTRNTVEDSIIKNLVITDEIPEGLEYVEGSLVVDGEAVSDAEDDDSGHMVEGTVEGQFGDIRDTDWHTLEFLVVVGEGQAGADIKNVASVEGDNTTTDEPEEEVKIYPREPKIESEKAAENLDDDKGRFEVGDTVVYTIKARNTVSDSEVKNLTITDELIEGLEYVEGSLTTDPEADATFEDGIFTANFGDVKDTEWRTMTFHAEIKVGQVGNELKNIATVEGEDVPPTHPEDSIKVEPKKPNLESEKSSALEEKARGNTKEESIEVGDTIRYTVTAKNTIEDSLVENMVITDEVPEGLTYVEGSLEVNGEQVTDEEDDDAGHVVDGIVTGTFGNVTDTEDYAISFLVTVNEGMAGSDIKNVAKVDGDNVDEPEEPEEEVTIEPREPKLESEKTVVNSDRDKAGYEVGDTIVYSIMTRNTVSDSLVENLTITDELPEGLDFVADSIEVSHEGTAEFKDGKIIASFGDVTDTEWRIVKFQVKVSTGQTGKTIENIAVVDGDNVDEPDKPREKVVIDPKSPKLDSEKSAENAEEDKENYEVGDTVIYTIKARNTVSDSLVENLMISDSLPEGLEFVEGSLEVSHEGNGEFKEGKIIANFGNVEDTDWRIVTFEVKIQSDQHGEVIKNIAEASGDNVKESFKPEAQIEVEPKEPTVTPEPEDPKEPKPTPEPKEQKPTKMKEIKGSEVIEATSGTDKGTKLPKTATNMYTFVLAGILLVLAGLGFVVIRRKNTRSN